MDDIEEVIYKKGRRDGLLLGGTIGIIALTFAYIVSQGILYWK